MINVCLADTDKAMIAVDQARKKLDIGNEDLQFMGSIENTLLEFLGL